MNRALTNGPLKILMVVSSYPRTADDTSSIFLRYLVDHLQKRGHSLYVVAPGDTSTGTKVENGITVRRFRYWPGRRQGLAYGSGILPNLKRNPWLWFQVPFFIASMIVVLLRTTRQLRPDILHAHWVIPQGFTAILAKLIYRVPVVITAHGGDAFALTGAWPQRLKRLCLRRSEGWTANTKATARALQAGLVPPPRIIPMGVDVHHFGSGRRERLRAEIPVDNYVILFVGRLVEKKGVDDLLHAFALFPAGIKAKSRLWIVGSGERESDLRRLASALGIAGETTFWGRIQNDQLPDYYAAADLFVGPSIVAESGDTEGQGVVFLEAFAARLCVLATRTGGIAEVIEDGRTGILVDPRDPPQLANAMVKILTDVEQRTALVAKAYAKVSEAYDWTTIAQQFDGLYRSILAHARSLNQSIVDRS